MTKVFGKENMAAAIAMINTADDAEAMTKAIVGTNSAVEQAEVIMGGYNEKVARTKAWFDDLKISAFNVMESFTPLVNMGFSGKLTYYGHILISTFNALSIAKAKDNIQSGITLIRSKALALWTGIGSVANKGFAASLNSVRNSAIGAAMGTRAFSVAIMNIPVIGWIIAGITAIIIALKYLWEHSRRFREILFGIGYAGKAIFHNIGVYAGRVWTLVLKPVGMFIFNLYKNTFLTIWEIVKTVWKNITNTITWAWNSVIKPIASFIYNVYKNAFMMIWNTVKTVFNWIVQLVSSVWNWIKSTFSEFAGWIQSTIIDPIYRAFSEIWDWLSGFFDAISEKIKAVTDTVKGLWNSIFSEVSIKEEYKKGEKAGGESFDKDKKKSKDDPQEVKIVDDNSHKNIFDVSKGSGLSTPTIGGVAAKKTKKKKEKSEKEDGESGNKVRSLTVGKMVENLNIYTQKGTVGESKEQILQAIKEIFGTAVADFAGADRNATTA